MVLFEDQLVADSYAWYFTYNWLDDHWKRNSNGSETYSFFGHDVLEDEKPN